MNTRSSRPIPLYSVALHYDAVKNLLPTVSHAQYLDTWRHWLTDSKDKILKGLDEFTFGDYVQGTSQAFDNFILRHCTTRTIVTFKGEFQYHSCQGKFVYHHQIRTPDELSSRSALIISVPFSGTGYLHSDFETIMQRCIELGIPVCLDLAYWGISKYVTLDLNQYPCVEEVVSSLSKPFFKLETHRIGVRFRRNYANDGISMQNEVGMHNLHSMSLGVSFMNKFSCDWNWQHLDEAYYKACKSMNLIPTDCVIFGLGGSEYAENNRGIPGVNRVCLSSALAEV